MKINYQMELTRSNVTPAQFLSYIRSQAKKHGISIGIDTKYFLEGEQHNGHYINSHYVAGTPKTRPCESEISKACPMDHQTYIRGFDGSVFNEIVEFSYDTETTGHGYYYIISADGEPEDAERIKISTIKYHARKIEENTRKIEKNTIDIEKTQNNIDRGYADYKMAGYFIKNLQCENDIMAFENDEHRAAIDELTEADTADSLDTEAETDTEKKYHDIESGETITEKQLLEEFENLKRENPAEYAYSFPEYVENCLTINNGTLERV